MRQRDDYLAMGDAALLAGCDVHTYKASGPGGQHRNKTSSAVRLHHRATGLSATGEESRSQHENKRRAVRRLRMHLACKIRRPVDLSEPEVPAALEACLERPRPRGGKSGRAPRLSVGKRDPRFWPLSALLLDLLEAAGGRLAVAAAAVGVTTSHLAGVLKSERHLLAAARAIRRSHGLGPLK